MKIKGECIMGTRGLYGLRMNGEDKLTYNHWDSYPSYLGVKIANFCEAHTPSDMREFYDCVTMVDEEATPTAEQINTCVAAGLFNSSVSTGQQEDWYCLLRNLQGDLQKAYELAAENGQVFMIDSQDFIKDSLFCEYAYIINLDTNMLEFWEGFQNTADDNNRYGTECQKSCSGRKYYPCRLVLEIPLEGLKANGAVEAMKAAAMNGGE